MNSWLGKGKSVCFLEMLKENPSRELFGLGLFAVWNVELCFWEGEGSALHLSSFCSVWERAGGSCLLQGRRCVETGTDNLNMVLPDKNQCQDVHQSGEKGWRKAGVRLCQQGRLAGLGSYSSCKELCCS